MWPWRVKVPTQNLWMLFNSCWYWCPETCRLHTVHNMKSVSWSSSGRHMMQHGAFRSPTYTIVSIDSNRPQINFCHLNEQGCSWTFKPAKFTVIEIFIFWVRVPSPYKHRHPIFQWADVLVTSRAFLPFFSFSVIFAEIPLIFSCLGRICHQFFVIFRSVRIPCTTSEDPPAQCKKNLDHL